jgi:phosphoribosylamine--glycine ligase
MNYFVILSEDGSGLPLALRLQDEKQKVYYAIEPKKETEKEIKQGVLKSGDGLVNKEDFKKIVNNLIRNKDKLLRRTIIVFDTNHHPDIADKLRKSGYKVIGSGTVFEKLEHDRKFGLQIMKKAVIRIPESYEFKQVDKAIRFLETQPETKKWVLKPANDESYLAFVSDDNDELIGHLDTYRDRLSRFILQEKIKGIECKVSGWFNGDKFVFFSAVLDRKRQANNDLGAMTDCSGDIVWRLSGAERIVVEGLKKVEAQLEVIGTPCMIDLNQIVNNKGLWGIEWTPRFGYNASLTLITLFDELLSDVLNRLANDQLIDIKTKPLIGASVRIFRDTIKSDVPVKYPDSIKNDVWIWDVQKSKTGLETAGIGKDIMAVTGQGKDITGAVSDMYKNAEQVELPDLTMRTDIGNKAKDDYNNLINLGWI